jgi:hypothetical protein
MSRSLSTALMDNRMRKTLEKESHADSITKSCTPTRHAAKISNMAMVQVNHVF